MIPIVLGLVFTFFTAIVVIAGDTILKLAADNGSGFWQPLVVLGCVLYAFSALMWFSAVRHITLAQAGVAYSALTLLALCAIGAIWFDEPIGAREVAGIVCALAAIVLMMRFA